MTNPKKWAASNGNFVQQNVASQIDELPLGVYQLKYSNEMGFYLAIVHEEFEIPSKIYGSDQVFIDRILHSFETLNSNLGVLLSGHKGSGRIIIY